MTIETERTDQPDSEGQQTPGAGPAAQDEGQEERPFLDIYALLGVTPDATPALARQLYWTRIEHYQAARERGEPGAVRTIEDLNEALTIILDDRRRAEYDRHYRMTLGAAAPAAPSFERSRRVRAGIVLALMLVTVGAALLASWLAGPVTVAIAVSAGLLAVIAAVSWPRRDAVGGRSPFTLLGLTEGATAHDVDIAYETIAQELLTRVKFDAGAIARLELLDQAYVRAQRLLAEESGEVAVRGESRPSRLAHAAGRQVAAALSAAAGALGALALAALVWLGRLTERAGRAAGRQVRQTSAAGVRLTADQLSVLSRHIQGEPEEDEPLPDVSIDIDRRVGTGLRTVAERAAARTSQPNAQPDAEGTPEEGRLVEPVSAFEEEEEIEAYLVLEAAAGRRKVPIRSAPLRVGSAANCDLVLPQDLGVAEEHVLVWQREGSLLLHVIDHHSSCLVNDRPMTWATLDHGDVLMVGNARFSVEAPGQA